MSSFILRVANRIMVGLILIFSVYLLFRGHNAPGGGFAGGLVMGSAVVLRYLASGPRGLRSLGDESSRDGGAVSSILVGQLHPERPLPCQQVLVDPDLVVDARRGGAVPTDGDESADLRGRRQHPRGGRGAARRSDHRVGGSGSNRCRLCGRVRQRLRHRAG